MRRRDASGRLRIVVYGYVVRGPLAGFAWHHLQYASGLMRLGHEVLFVEDGGDSDSCYDPMADLVSEDSSYGLTFMRDACAGFGISNRWAFYDIGRGIWCGPYAQHATEYCASADLLINLNDPESLPSWLAEIPNRALVDTDPAFMQIANLQSTARHAAVAQHTVLFTFGEAISAGTSTVPSDGFQWLPTRQPIDFELWPAAAGSPAGRWTTVMQWDSYPVVEYLGKRYGMKSASFDEYVDLPSRVSQPLEIALGSPSAPREHLTSAGWILRNPLPISCTPWNYANYIKGSKGELSVAKHGYVVSACGWFSERTACFLASGRPAVVQETGFSSILPSGLGLLTFVSADEAVAQLIEADRNYSLHCRGARDMSREWFDASRVLSSLVDRAMGRRVSVAADSSQESG